MLVLISLLLLTNIVFSSVNVYMTIFNVIIVCHYKKSLI
ncbi:putative membrane protein [Escherichia coli 2-156-04_S3_C2]|nr:putative membrane protein [Escherichia coli 2-156-04_S3_C2]